MLQHGKALQLCKPCGNSSEMRRCTSEWSRRRIVLIISVHSKFRMATTTGMEFRSCTWRWGAAFTANPRFMQRNLSVATATVVVLFPSRDLLSPVSVFVLLLSCILEGSVLCLTHSENFLRRNFLQCMLLWAPSELVWHPVLFVRGEQEACVLLFCYALKILQYIWKTNGS